VGSDIPVETRPGSGKIRIGQVVRLSRDTNTARRESASSRPARDENIRAIDGRAGNLSLTPLDADSFVTTVEFQGRRRLTHVKLPMAPNYSARAKKSFALSSAQSGALSPSDRSPRAQSYLLGEGVGAGVGVAAAGCVVQVL
jgi:hypothetical protein